MNARLMWFVWVCNLAAVTAHAATLDTRPRPRPKSIPDLPLAFELNRGQTDPGVRFLARASGINLYLTEDGALLSMHERRSPPIADHMRPTEAPWQLEYLVYPVAEPPAAEPLQALALRYGFADANPHPRIEGLDPLPGHTNYLIGNDPTQWHIDIPQFRRVRYHDVYPGVDVVYYGNEGRLEFDVEVAPGADLAQVRLKVEGAEAVALGDRGDLRVRTALGDLVQRKPVVYQIVAGERRELRGDYLLNERAHEVAFEVPHYDHRVALVLDPTLVASLLVGGSGPDTGIGVATDASGNWYFSGNSNDAATDFPTTIGAYQTTQNGVTDVFVRKVSNDGATVIYSTLIGGNGSDSNNGIGVDAAGNAYITGHTQSTNFPTSNALQGTNPGNLPSFVSALNASGNGLVYSTYLGGNGGTFANGIAVDSAGNAYVAGYTTATNLLTSPGAFQTSIVFETSAFVFKFNATGARVFGTYIVDDSNNFGFGYDHANAIAIDDNGNSYIAGYASTNIWGSYNGVVPSRIGPGGGSGNDMLLARLNNTGTWLDWATLIGGGGEDQATALAVNAGHQILVAGWSASSDLPPSPGPTTQDWTWIGRIDETGTQLMDSLWIGSATASAFPQGIVWDDAIIVGHTDNAGGLTALNAMANDCGASCGSSGDNSGFFATLKQDVSGLFAIDTLTRITGGNSSANTQLNGVAEAPGTATHNVAANGVTDGAPPGTSRVDTGDQGYQCIVDAPNTPPYAPRVDKTFEPPAIALGEKATLTFVIRNPSQDFPLTNLMISDQLPACLAFQPGFGGGCSGGAFPNPTFDASGVHISTDLPPGGSCTVYLTVKAVSTTTPCNNTTSAITSDQGSPPPAKAALVIRPAVATSTWNGNGANTNTSTSANFDVPQTKGGDTVFPNSPKTIVTNNQTVVQNQITVSGSNYAIGGASPLGVLGALVNTGSSNTISAPLTAEAANLFVVSDPIAASLTLGGGIATNGGRIAFDGAGTKTVNGVISGAGRVDLLNGYVTLNTSPTIVGDFNVLGGTLAANVNLVEKTFLNGDGILRGIGAFGPIEQRGGTFYPGTGTTPTTVDVFGDLTLVTRFALDASTSSSHSTVNASGSVLAAGLTVQINFATPPAINTTISGLIVSPGGLISGCPDKVIAAQPNLILQPLCTANSISAKLIGNDRISADSFDVPAPIF